MLDTINGTTNLSLSWGAPQSTDTEIDLPSLIETAMYFQFGGLIAGTLDRLFSHIPPPEGLPVYCTCTAFVLNRLALTGDDSPKMAFASSTAASLGTFYGFVCGRTAAQIAITTLDTINRLGEHAIRPDFPGASTAPYLAWAASSLFYTFMMAPWVLEPGCDLISNLAGSIFG